MTTPDKLFSLQEVEKLISITKPSRGLPYLQQLADTMRESESLAKSLEKALKLIQGNTPLEMGRVTSEALENYRNKESDNGN